MTVYNLFHICLHIVFTMTIYLPKNKFLTTIDIIFIFNCKKNSTIYFLIPNKLTAFT